MRLPPPMPSSAGCTHTPGVSTCQARTHGRHTWKMKCTVPENKSRLQMYIEFGVRIQISEMELTTKTFACQCHNTWMTNTWQRRAAWWCGLRDYVHRNMITENSFFIYLFSGPIVAQRVTHAEIKCTRTVMATPVEPPVDGRPPLHKAVTTMVAVKQVAWNACVVFWSVVHCCVLFGLTATCWVARWMCDVKGHLGEWYSRHLNRQLRVLPRSRSPPAWPMRPCLREVRLSSLHPLLCACL